LLGGVTFSLVLYLRNRREDFSSLVNWILAIVRFIAVSIIAFLLLAPLLRSVIRTTEKPLLIFAQDNSQSILFCKDSNYYKNIYPEEVKTLLNDLRKDYDVKVYSFGDRLELMDDNVADIEFSFGEKQTDISSVFKDIQTRFSNRNVGAIIIASDGLYNVGMNPRYGSQKNIFPLYTIALGDTSIQRDILISKVNYNRLAYQGNKFPVEVIIRANKLTGQRSRLDIYRKNERLFSKTIDITSDKFTETIFLELDANESGLQRYHLSLTRIEGEITLQNNVYDIYIDVLDARQKILMISAAPHPDISAIKQAIETNYNYEVEDYLVDEFKESVDKYDLLILHQVPTLNKSLSNLIGKVVNSKLPVLYILGARSRILTVNQLNTGVDIISQTPEFNESLPVINPDFELFVLSDETKMMLENFPPLSTPFGQYNMTPTASVLLWQRIGNVTTDLPLILFDQNLELKTGVIAGEGIWKWRMINYARNENHKAFNELILKFIQYLSLKDDRSFFRIQSKNRFVENEPIEFEAEVYNKSYELINTPEVKLTITNEEGTDFPFNFGKRGKAYWLNAGLFPPGNYSYLSRVVVGNDTYTKYGEFSVEVMNIERISTIADHDLLYNLAEMHDGEMLLPAGIDQLKSLLDEREDIKPVVYSQKRFNELNNIYWVLILIVLLLGTEWFVRKFHGSY